MTAAVKMINADMLLNEEQLEQVAGGMNATLVIGCLKTSITTGMDVYKETKNLINSKEYAAMSQKQKNKAIGKIFANNVAFGAMLGAGAGLIYAQTKWRIFGVSDEIREGAEKLLKK